MAKSKPSRSRFPLAQDRPNKPAVKKTISRDVTCKAEQTRSKLYVLFVEREKHERLHRRNAFPSNPLAKSPPTITKNENPDDDHNSISRGTRQKSRRYIPKGSERGRYFRESPRGHPSPVGNFAGGTSANGRGRLSSNPSSIVHLLQGDHNDQIGDFCGIGGNAGISTPSSNRIGDRKCLGPCKYSINVVNTSCIRCGAPRLNAMSSNPPTSHETLKPEWTEIETVKSFLSIG